VIRLFSILATVGVLSTSFGELKESPIDTYQYTKVGATLLFQNIGWGSRTHNLTEKTGFDTSFNTNICIPALIDGGFLAFPSYKYTTLKYRNATLNSRYTGVGYELGLLTLSGKGGTLILPFPNIEFVWGTERDNMRFSQLGFNVIPAASLIAGGFMASTSRKGGLDGIIFAAGAIAASTVILSYTVGF